MMAVAAALSGCGVAETGLLKTGPASDHALMPKPGSPARDDEIVTLRSLGHASLVIEQGGHVLLVDPLLKPRLAGLAARWRRAPDVEQLPADVEAVLITHGHADHYDPWTLSHVDHKTLLVAPHDVSDRAAAMFDERRPLAPWESIEVGCWTITAVPAWHPTGRRLRGKYDPSTTIGYVIQGKGPTVYVSGDTEYRDHLKEIGRRFKIDVAVFNVNIHLKARRAVQAANDVGARVWAPMHWGGYPGFDTFFQAMQMNWLRRKAKTSPHMAWLPPGHAAQFTLAAEDGEPIPAAQQSGSESSESALGGGATGL